MLKNYIYIPDMDTKIALDAQIHSDEITDQIIYEAMEDRAFGNDIPAPRTVRAWTLAHLGYCNVTGAHPYDATPLQVALCNDVITRVMQARSMWYANGISTALVIHEMEKLPAFQGMTKDEMAVDMVKLLIADSQVKAAHDNCILANLGITATDMQILIDHVREHPWQFMNDDYVYVSAPDAENGIVVGSVWHPTTNPVATTLHPEDFVEVELEEEINGERYLDLYEDDLVYVNPQPKGIRYLSYFEQIAELNERRLAVQNALEKEKEENERLLEELPLNEMYFEQARFVRGCEEKNGHLYQDGKRLDNDRMPATYKNVWYTHQTADGYCEDSYFGTLYFKTKEPGVFVAVPYSI